MFFFANAMPYIAVEPHPDPPYRDVPDKTSGRPVVVCSGMSCPVDCPVVVRLYSSRHCPTVIKYILMSPLPSVVGRRKETRRHVGVDAWYFGHHYPVERYVHRADVVRYRKQSPSDGPKGKARRIVRIPESIRTDDLLRLDNCHLRSVLRPAANDFQIRRRRENRTSVYVVGDHVIIDREFIVVDTRQCKACFYVFRKCAKLDPLPDAIDVAVGAWILGSLPDCGEFKSH